MRLSIVVPCFNEQDVLPELYQRVTSIAQQVAYADYELVLVNDGSTDATWMMIQSWARTDKHLIGINLTRNFGHQAALTAGLEHTSGERILIIDADLQDPPELLPEMMAALDNGADVAYGKRLSREKESLFKRSSAALFYRLLAQLSDVEIPLDAGDFRLMTRRVLEAFRSMPERQRFIRGMIAWTGFNQVAVPYHRRGRSAGASKYPLQKMLSFAAGAIASFSISPLRVSVFFALVFAMMGGVGLVYVLFSWLALDHVKGWTSLAAIVCILGSTQLLVIGILGEYIGRIYMETKSRPLYLIEGIIGNHSPTERVDTHQQ